MTWDLMNLEIRNQCTGSLNAASNKRNIGAPPSVVIEAAHQGFHKAEAIGPVGILQVRLQEFGHWTDQVRPFAEDDRYGFPMYGW